MNFFVLMVFSACFVTNHCFFFYTTSVITTYFAYAVTQQYLLRANSLRSIFTQQCINQKDFIRVLVNEVGNTTYVCKFCRIRV
jgi:hypothetical protein